MSLVRRRPDARPTNLAPGTVGTTYGPKTPTEPIPDNFAGYVSSCFRGNGIVAAVEDVRLNVFAEARFQWQALNSGTPGKLFGTPELGILETPWVGGTTGDLLTRMILDADFAGNAYVARIGGELVRLRPDWVDIVLAPRMAPYGPGKSDAQVGYTKAGYVYWEGGKRNTRDMPSATFLPNEVAHFCVDEETEILTADGWKDYRSLNIGDEALTLNHETGLTEWQPVSDVCVFPAQRREMVHMEGEQHSSLTTLNHRWPVEYRISRRKTYGRRWVTSETLGAGDRIPLAAYPGDLPQEAKWSDALVETVAWFWTEGRFKSGKARGTKARGIEIAQSLKNADHAARIRAALTVLFGPPVERIPKTGPRADQPLCWRESVDDDMLIFRLSANASDVITQHAPGKIVTTPFLRSLTASQIALFIQVSMWADNGGQGKLAQKSKAAAEQFALACIMAGHAVSIRERSAGSRPDGRAYDRMTVVRIRKDRHLYPQESKRSGETRFKIRRVDYDGHVWCPRTPNQTWLARRNGSVYFTGNSPKPDPLATFRGMSWLTPVIREVQADQHTVTHKLKFFENNGGSNLAVVAKENLSPEQFHEWVDSMERAHAGVRNSYKTLYLSAGADPVPLGQTMQQMDFANTQGAGEVRIANAAGIHPVVIGLVTALGGSSLNAGNYGAAKRSTVDRTFRPLWRNVCGSLQAILKPPAGGQTRLWTDVSDIAFLRDDEKDLAEIHAKEAQTVRTLLDAGFDAESVKAAVIAGDWSLLTHSGLFSVQLQAPIDHTGHADAQAATDAQAAADAEHARKMSIAESVQKVYLGVGKLITSDEAREIVNESGGDPPVPGPDFEHHHAAAPATPPTPPAPPAARLNGRTHANALESP